MLQKAVIKAVSDIEQYIWGMTREGEAVVVYNITNQSGTGVRLFNNQNAKIWESSVEGDRVIFGLYIEDENLGNLQMEVSYTLNDDNELEVLTMARSDAAMIVDLSNLIHFNTDETEAVIKEVLSNQEEADVSSIELIPNETYVRKVVYKIIHNS